MKNGMEIFARIHDTGLPIHYEWAIITAPRPVFQWLNYLNHGGYPLNLSGKITVNRLVTAYVMMYYVRQIDGAI